MKKIGSVIFLSFLVLFLLVFSFPSISFSEQPDSKVWEYFRPNHYYNKTNITKSSNIISVWIYNTVTDDERKETIEIVKKDDLEKSRKYQNLDHTVSLLKIDCEEELIKMEELIDYDDKGQKIEHEMLYKSTDWGGIRPYSVVEELYDTVCESY